jgi:hypothetical protein
MESSSWLSYIRRYVAAATTPSVALEIMIAPVFSFRKWKSSATNSLASKADPCEDTFILYIVLTPGCVIERGRGLVAPLVHRTVVARRSPSRYCASFVDHLSLAGPLVPWETIVFGALDTEGTFALPERAPSRNC